MSQDVAVKAVVLMVVLLVVVAHTLKAVVVAIDGVVMHMQRRENHQWQIGHQQ